MNEGLSAHGGQPFLHSGAAEVRNRPDGTTLHSSRSSNSMSSS